LLYTIVLDNNKLLTLPNGEWLNIPSKVRVMLEVQQLKYASSITTGRYGMNWFSEDIIELIGAIRCRG
jgi:dynein heavy chain 1, cytosolic